ncbi:MAG: PH domain-containing protein [Lachnospiraceae bacterium]|jgi:conserved domain protein|nr:MAG: PH domain-containing protein [Lachnospiraceae bacterium]
MADTNVEILWKDRKRGFLGLPLSFTKYSLTKERLFVETGFINSVENEVRLYRILDVQMTRNLGQKMFGLGSINVHSSDASLKDFTIKNIKKPKYVKELLSELVEKQRDEKRVVNRELMASSIDDDELDDHDDDTE